MANFKAVVRKKRADGFYPVYIRIVHRSRMGYIKTSKIVTDKQLSKTGEIKDPVVNDYCSREILRYSDLVNRKDVSHFSVAELIEYLNNLDEEVNFSEYANKFIARMREEGHERNAKNYRLAVDHLQRYLGSTEVMFSRLTTTTINNWIDSLSLTNRAKEMYPTCVRQIFKKALVELNDEERGLIRIKYNPWLKVSIPKSDRTMKLAISVEACREFFNRPLPKTKMLASTPELGRDIALLIFCLGGINTVDLYNLKKEDYHDGIISYKRAKTRHSRADEAYMEMRVEPFIQTTFNKYLADEEDEYLFVFHSRYRDSDSFCAGVNIGIRKICIDMGMKKEQFYCGYTFRHTWATIAQNDCDANIADVAFGLNHSQGYKVTRGYVKIDFTRAWELNAKVIDFVFFSNKKSKQGKARDLEEPAYKLFRISPKMMIHARAYFKGEVVAELTNIGFSNINQVIAALAPHLPKDMPVGCTVQFRLTNCDNQQEMVYERSKGKGF